MAGTLILGRTPGVLRPALGSFLPTQAGSIFGIDLGATTDAKPEYLEQFALMGSLYVTMVKGIEKPRVALLCNGTEPYKGSLLVKQTYDRLMQNAALNFVGNLEARDLFDDQADVVVCDGFVGNIMLKTAQGTARTMIGWLRQEAATSWRAKAALMLGAPMFKKLKQKTDYASSGGALLFGVAHPLLVAHGCSTAAAVEKSLIVAHDMMQHNLIARFNSALTKLMHETGSSSVSLDNTPLPERLERETSL